MYVAIIKASHGYFSLDLRLQLANKLFTKSLYFESAWCLGFGSVGRFKILHNHVSPELHDSHELQLPSVWVMCPYHRSTAAGLSDSLAKSTGYSPTSKQ